MHDNISSKRQRSLQNNYIIFGRAVKLIQTKWLEISYVITETKVKTSFSFQIKAGQFGIISLWQLRVGIGYLIPYLGSEILHWRDFCGSWIKRSHWYSYGKRERGEGEILGYKISTHSSAYPWCFWKPLVPVKASQSDCQIVTRIFFPVQNT